MTEKQRIIAGALEQLVYGRFSKESLEEQLSMVFEEPITIELGCEDVDYLTDWNYMFTSNHKEWGGDFDIYVLFHKDKRKGFDGATFMVTEVTYDFFN